MTKRIIAAGLGLALLGAGTARAADLPGLAFPYSGPPALWTGFYAGLNAGAAIDDSKYRLTPAGAGFGAPFSGDDLAFLSRRGRSDELGFTGGGQAGYNFQVYRFVFGAETDFNYAGIESRRNASVEVPGAFAGGTVGALQQLNGGAPLAYQTGVRQSVDWFGTVRGRAGYATGPFLLYGTGGLAYGDVGTNAVALASPAGFLAPAQFGYAARGSDVRIGWTAGGGVEYALGRNLSLRAEYLHVDLGSKNRVLLAQGGASAVAPGSAYVLRDEARFQVVRAGLNYRW